MKEIHRKRSKITKYTIFDRSNWEKKNNEKKEPTFCSHINYFSFSRHDSLHLIIRTLIIKLLLKQKLYVYAYFYTVIFLLFVSVLIRICLISKFINFKLIQCNILL